MSFHQSLRPMLLWMRFIGVFIESPGSGEFSSPAIRIWITCYGFIIFFVNIFSNGLQITGFFFTYMAEYMRVMTAASVWNASISNLNLASMTIFCQLTLICSAAVKWPRLSQVLCKMERENCFDSRDYHKFRRIFLAGFTSVMIMAVIIAYLLIIPVWTLDWPVSMKLRYSFPLFCLLFVFSGGALFCSLGWMASSMLDILAKQVSQINVTFKKEEEVNNWVKRIDTWRHQHHMICQFVDEINYCYGPLLLVLITSAFVQMIVLSYDAMQNVSESNFFSLIRNLMILALQFFFFLVLIYVPHRISESAVYFGKQLRSIEIGTSVIENDYKINHFARNVLNSLPRITALGFFEIDLQLAPTLIGTTLTYLIILCQFAYSSN